MKIQLLRRRENFEAIFESSVMTFLERYFGNSCRIEWDHSLHNKFLVNDYLNVIYPTTISRQLLDSLTWEYAWSESLLKRELQRAYVNFATRWPCESIATTGKMSIDGCPVSLDQWVFIPGNHSIRIVDFENEVCIVFVKQEFDRSFFIADVETRDKMQLPNTPRLLEMNLLDGWYMEERVNGLPLNRLSRMEDRKQAFRIAGNNLLCLQRDSLTTQRLERYVLSLQNKIDSVLGRSFSNTPRPDFEKIDLVRERLIGSLNEFAQNQITTAMTHGDFQPANIIYDAATCNCWLIDWEYSAIRSVFYDALVFELDARVGKGLAGRYEHCLESLESGQLPCAWIGHALTAESSFYLALFLIEDLLVRLEEVATSAICDKFGSLTPWLNEVIRIPKFCLPRPGQFQRN